MAETTENCVGDPAVDSVGDTQVPLRVIRASSVVSLADLTEILQCSDLLWILSLRDIKLRYAQTVLGVLWVILQPLVAAVIFTFVFGVVARLPSGGVPYIVFSYAGLQAWSLFHSIVTRASVCLVNNAQLITKIYFPRLILPLSALAAIFVDFGVAMAMLVVLQAWYGLMPGWGLLTLPIWIAILTGLSFGLGLFFGTLMVSYRDVQFLLPVGLQMLLYASPVAYGASAIPEKYKLLYYLNPVAGPLDAFRWSLLSTPFPPWLSIVWSMLLTPLAMLFGMLMFKRMERTFADVI
jgi:lipopolysaccharide transport system permease protein